MVAFVSVKENLIPEVADLGKKQKAIIMENLRNSKEADGELVNQTVWNDVD